jgi:hypothetical protein
VKEPKVFTPPGLVVNRALLFDTDPRKSKFPGNAVELNILVGPDRSAANMTRRVLGKVFTIAELEKKYPTSKKSATPETLSPTKMLAWLINALKFVELNVKLWVAAMYWGMPKESVETGTAAGSHVTDPLYVLDAAPPTPERSTVPEKSIVIVIARAGAALRLRRSTATPISSFFIKALASLDDMPF